MTNILKNGYRRKSMVIKSRTRASRTRKSRVYSRKTKKQSRMRMDNMKRLKNMFKSIAKKIRKSMSRKMRNKKQEHKTEHKTEHKHSNSKERYSKELFKNQQFIAEEEDKLMNLLAQYKETKNKDLIKDIDHTKINIIKLGQQIDRLDKNLKRYRTNELLERRILKNKIIEE
jgi:hypothetical protein